MSQTTLDIKEPGLNVLPPGVERHVINAGGLTGLQIFPDDEIEIINNEGGQICEISVFNKNGKSDSGILNLKNDNKDLTKLKKTLNKKDEASQIVVRQLKKGNLKDYEWQQGDSFTITLAANSLEGNKDPFKEYSIFDFDLADSKRFRIPLEDGCDVITSSKNIIMKDYLPM